MDSLTHFVLGAAVGEVCLGKKLGNRAMFWGAVANTVPDLDILGNLWMSQLDSLVFHRGISHSITFALIFPCLMAWLVKRYYEKEKHRSSLRRIITSSLGSLFVILISVLFIFIAKTLGTSTITFTLTTATACGLGLVFILRLWKYYGLANTVNDVNVSFKEWYIFFFFTIISHPVIDCFTVYGTQFFAPFSNMRVSFDNIAIADPFYTLPLAFCLMCAGFNHKTSFYRRFFNYLGLAISSIYIVFTFYNKSIANEVINKTIVKENIASKRFMTNPSILNNILWTGTIETDSAYYHGLYSLNDKEPLFKLTKYEKGHQLLNGLQNTDHTIKTLRWFSKDYYTVTPINGDTIQLNDMRYGTFRGRGNSKNDYIFNFRLVKDASGNYEMIGNAGGPPRGSEQQMMHDLIERVKGI